MTKIIAVISQKGGSGKTTALLNLAVAAHRDGRAVLVVDLDPQASATLWHRARADKTLVVQPTHPAGIANLLKVAQEQGVELVFIDTAAQTDSNAAEAVEVADLVLITCRPSVMDLRAIPNSIRLCRIRDRKPHVVLTQIETQGTLQDEARRTLASLGVDVLDGGLGRRAAFHHSIIDGRSAAEYEPSGKAAQEVRRLYQTVCQLVGLPSSHRVTKEGTR
ncbi:MAG: ParA family protein [Nitrospirae bacterium]|nr:MAG: ParA family protein [Nitrospirota bacterium]